ncbi:MAG: aldolase/citrate lyase family protein [Halobacteriales archaeon]|nr:aldolase/citrate lyase family protein [Halobacteriales archaeon]
MTYQNHIRETIESGGAVFGVGATTLSPLMVEVYADLGYDYVWLDFEHIGPSAYDSGVFEGLVRTADAAGIDLLCRIPSGEPDLVRKVLDAGVRTILVPRLETAEQVREAVAASRFAYDGGPGERGVAKAQSSGWGARPTDYADREDGTVLCGIMLENQSMLDGIDEVLAVPDLGFCFIGPMDLSVSLGHPLDPSHPEVQEAQEQFRAACVDAGVPVGCIRNDPAAAAEAVEDGFQILRVGDEVGAARSVLGQRLNGIHERVESA